VKKISFGNKEYVKAAEAAKKFKYTQDYVGQLCRGDKIDARLVGRVWYVNLESITDYRKTKHAAQRKVAKRDAVPVKIVNKSKVEPVVRPKTARAMKGSGLRGSDPSENSIHTKYSRDKVAIIPILHSDRSTKTDRTTVATEQVIIEPAPKVTIKVRPNTKKATQYFAEKMPEITLQSKLQVTESTEKSLAKSIAATAKQEPRKTITVTKHEAVGPTEQVSVSDSAQLVERKPKETQTKPTQRSSYYQTGLIVVILFLGIMAAAFVLGLTWFIDVSPATSQSGVQFQLPNLIQNLLEIVT